MSGDTMALLAAIISLLSAVASGVNVYYVRQIKRSHAIMEANQRERAAEQQRAVRPAPWQMP